MTPGCPAVCATHASFTHRNRAGGGGGVGGGGGGGGCGAGAGPGGGGGGPAQAAGVCCPASVLKSAPTGAMTTGSTSDMSPGSSPPSPPPPGMVLLYLHASSVKRARPVSAAAGSITDSGFGMDPSSTANECTSHLLVLNGVHFMCPSLVGTTVFSHCPLPGSIPSEMQVPFFRARTRTAK